MKNQNEPNANEPIISNRLAPYWKEIREKLFPIVEQAIHKATDSELTEGLKRVAQILEIVRIEEHVPSPKTGGRGRGLIDRRPLARAFVAKAALNLPDTRALIEQLKQNLCLLSTRSLMRRLCGMTRVRSEATFSRAFATFACLDLGGTAHQKMVERFVSEQIVMHLSHDSTAVAAREKAAKQVKPDKPDKVKKSVVGLAKGKNTPQKNSPVWNDR